LYLSKLDHYILEELKPSGYVRYMDDFVLFSNQKSELLAMSAKIDAFALNSLNLRVKQPVIGKTEQGLPFLGLNIKKTGMYLLGKSKKRIKNRITAIQKEVTENYITEQKAADRMISVYAAVRLARTRRFKVQLWNRCCLGCEPCVTRR
jgi:hypothetical protein